MQSTDDSVDTVGTVIDPSGLTVLSLGALNPGAMMNRMMGAGGTGENKMEVDERADRSEDPAARRPRAPARRSSLRDEDLDLAFIRPTTKPSTPLVAIDLADAANRRSSTRSSSCRGSGGSADGPRARRLQEIGAIIEQPRTFFVLSGSSGSMGTPAFTLGGKVVGLLTLRQIDAGRSSMMAMMGGTEALGLLPVILPAADVLEIAKQTTEK